jgi:hypothetical protein
MEKKYRNFMAADPYLWNGCCGSVMVGADGSADPVPENKTITIVTVLMMVGLAAVVVYAFNKIK